MACDGEKGMMEMNKEEELLQQQPDQQRPQLPGAVDQDPWPPPMPAGIVDESNSDWEIASNDFQVFVLGGRAAAGSFAFGKFKQEGCQSNRDQESNWNQEDIGTGWSFSTFGVVGTRRLVGALPVRGQHVYVKRGGLTTGCRDRKTCIIFKYHSNT